MFKKILVSIGSFFTKEAPVLETAISGAIPAVNIIKTFLGSATGQTIEAIIEALLPGTSTVVISGLNELFTSMGTITPTGTECPADLAAMGLNAVAKLTGKAKVYALSNITSIIANEADNANGGTSTPQQTIVAVPVAYNPSVLDGPNVPAA